ncbi:alpha/beta fold hydrolase [Actinomadura algeriensis]|uniref:Pimeloyl-ACP methyl ester carboxylesterase n=1 Tax=Actinomadura algeriensis TaxID=1679523 RepID=A0ABR9JLJ4_9ACTN|nr:alpha/beta hydrolase [Actinomadura algeriensis]MBE1531426.1 pimeloyl-ACP methyl ester carboxylesterase [Actinomadura algeriensis]
MSEIVNVGREQVHVVRSGPVDGPPLLLDSGLGGAWFDWEPVTALLRDAYRVTVFDRPGLGTSPAGAAPPSLRRDVALAAALAGRASGGAPGRPVTIVAHSMAAFCAEALARLRPELVRGLVLVDPSHEHEARARVRLSPVLSPAFMAAGALLDATGAADAVGPWGRRAVLRHTSRAGDPAADEDVREVYGRGTVIGTALAENFAYREMAADLAALRARRPFPPVPLVVLTALDDVRRDACRRAWADGHARLAAMSPHGRQVRLPEARHMIHLDRPDAVADAVAEVHRAVAA